MRNLERLFLCTEKNPDKKVIRLGIGDVTLPLGSEIISQLHKGVDALTSTETFKGYGPEQGYDFLRNAIVDYFFVRIFFCISIDAVCYFREKVAFF